MYSKNLIIQLLGELVQHYGINDVIFSPGSRNAPLSIHFGNNKNFNHYVVVDERSAAFFALGIAQSQQKPTMICCTSGTAAANYYPAIIESFYQNIPLLIVTADRPENYVDIFDGQTIRQKNIYSNHIINSYQLTEDSSYEGLLINSLNIKKAIQECILHSGPVHINIPLSEPLYEQSEKIEIYEKIEKIEINDKADFPKKNILKDWINILPKWNMFNKKLILVGIHQPDTVYNELLSSLADRDDTVILTEVTSNVYSEKFISNIDRVINHFTKEDIELFKPDLLLTLGQNIVSKKVKSFLRKSELKEHWHVDKYWHPDTFFSITEKITENPVEFLEKLVKEPKIDSEYASKWKNLKDSKDKKHHELISTIPFSDLKVMEILSNVIPENWNIQISNSSMIRYAQFFKFEKNHACYCNRETSGIDGCTSTAIGFSVKSKNPTILITGDISFFYDSNALWNNYIPNNFRIIVMNNGGGDIFNIIPGPSGTEVLNKSFVAKHKRSAEGLAKEYNFEYNCVTNLEHFNQILNTFFMKSDKPKLLEINTQYIDNAKILHNYFKSLNS